MLSSIKFKTRIKNIIIYIFLSLGALMMAIPYAWMMVTSFKPIEEIQTYPPSFLIRHPTVEAYHELFHLIPMARYLVNSIFIASTVTLCSLFLCSLAAYAFAKHNFWGRDKIFLAFLGSMMIPWQVNLIPGFIIIRNLGWLNTFYALIIPNMAGAFGIFLCRQFILSIPNDLLDAARIDGCGEFKIYRLVILPLIKPVLATLAIFTFLSQWNSFVWPLIIIHSQKMRTVPLALAVLNAQYGNNFAMVMAGATVITIPVLVVFIAFQKYFIKGIALTGLRA